MLKSSPKSYPPQFNVPTSLTTETFNPGDVLIRFHDVGPVDRFDIDVLIEVKSKWFVDRCEDRQRHVDEIHAAVHQVASEHQIGVYLTLPVAAWEQTGQQPE